MALARDLQARALAADNAETAADLGAAFHRVARSVRQTYALEAKLQRDHHRQAREDRADAARAAATCARRLRDQVRATVTRAIWNEAEGDEAERLLDDLELHLDALPDEPVEAQITRLCADLGITPPSPPPTGEERHSPTSPPPPSSS